MDNIDLVLLKLGAIFSHPITRGVHSPVRSGFNIKNQPNRKMLFLVNITRTEPVQTEPVLFGSDRFFSLTNQKNRNQLNKKNLAESQSLDKLGRITFKKIVVENFESKPFG
jgi:hypothetical protein